MEDKPRIIDPMPRLGDILNHFEAMITRNAAVTERLCQIAQSAGVPLDNLEDLYSRMAEAHRAYWAFKETLPTGEAHSGE